MYTYTYILILAIVWTPPGGTHSSRGGVLTVPIWSKLFVPFRLGSVAKLHVFLSDLGGYVHTYRNGVRLGLTGRKLPPIMKTGS